MHPTPIFRLNDEDRSLDFINTHPFALLAVNGEGGPVTALAPLVVAEGNQTLLGHVARANPFWQAAQASEKSVAIFRGVDGYISPSNYASKKEHGKAVPTWNYVALEIRGEIQIETDPLKMGEFLAPLTDRMESRRDDPWAISDAPDDYIAKLSRGIVGVRLSIEHMTHVRKLSQDKSDADRQGVLRDLAGSQINTDKALLKEMQG